MVWPRMLLAPDTVRRCLTLFSIAASARPIAGAYSASMEVSTRCNFTCRMCPYHSVSAKKTPDGEKDFVDMAVAHRIVEGAARLGVKVVNFGGRGEPLLHPELADIIRLVKRAGLQSKVFTNGSLLTQRRIEEFMDAGLSTLGVSLVGASEESYARIHPEASSFTFRRILDSVVLLQQLKRDAGRRLPKLDLRFILMDDSHREAERMVDLGVRLGADSITLMPLGCRSDVDVDPFAPSRDEEKLAIDRLRELAPKAHAAGLQISLDEATVNHLYGPLSNFFPCSASWIEISALVDGSITFCVTCHLAVGNVNERPLEEIWYGTKYHELRKLFRDPAERTLVGECNCNSCCLFYTNWRTNRRLASLGLASEIGPVGLRRSWDDKPYSEVHTVRRRR